MEEPKIEPKIEQPIPATDRTAYSAPDRTAYSAQDWGQDLTACSRS